jgi:trimeric autotransporter adhesin
MKGNKPMKTTTNITYPTFALFAFACFALLQNAQAVVPPPDGHYANQNTAEGKDALFSLTTGFENTAVGAQALYSLTTGAVNTALGFQALYNGITASGNTVVGDQALFSNIAGTRNVAVGATALQALTSGEMNTAVGNLTLEFGESVNFNTALGRRALSRTQGDQNTGLGFFSGSNLNGGTNNIYIGNAGPVPIGPESNTIRIGTQTATVVTIGVESHPMPAHTATFIAGISGVAVMGPAVHVSRSGQLGAVASSRRFKDDIKPMDKASEAILALEPVSFRYKREIDPDRTPQFGLVAEEVEKVNPDLVARDPDGKAFTVRYDAVNAMLLNEFLKEHRKVQEQEATIAELKSIAARQEMINAQQQRETKALAATLREQASQIQKVSAQLELEKAPAQTVVNNR